jgi:hypothetical protein
MLETYRSLAYWNVVRGNTFTNCNWAWTWAASEETWVVKLISYWSGGGPLLYGNQFINNTVDSGRIFIERQRNFIFKDNNISTDVIKVINP